MRVTLSHPHWAALFVAGASISLVLFLWSGNECRASSDSGRLSPGQFQSPRFATRMSIPYVSTLCLIRVCLWSFWDVEDRRDGCTIVSFSRSIREIRVMPQSPRSRKTARLSRTIHKQLNMYAFAAGAAGAGMLALAVPAQGRIVYTPDNQKIPPSQELSLDLNHDGINDFIFSNFYSSTSSTLNLSIGPENPSNEIFSTGGNGHSTFAAALLAGRKIGPHGRFRKLLGDGMANGEDPNGKCQGPWVNAHERYLGLKFIIKGEIHFGWARLNVRCVYPHAINATLTGYAYETIPNKPIIAGQMKGLDDATVEGSDAALTAPTRKPAALGLLAMGSPGLSVWRREESGVAAPRAK